MYPILDPRGHRNSHHLLHFTINQMYPLIKLPPNIKSSEIKHSVIRLVLNNNNSVSPCLYNKLQQIMLVLCLNAILMYLMMIGIYSNPLSRYLKSNNSQCFRTNNKLSSQCYLKIRSNILKKHNLK